MYSQDTWTIPLGSRKNTCIHKDVKKLKSVQRMNEACLELQKKSKSFYFVLLKYTLKKGTQLMKKKKG